MSSIRDWMARRSGVQLFFIYGVLFGVLMGLIMPSIGLQFSTVAAIIVGALFGASMSIATVRSRRRSGGQGKNIQLNAAIQSGNLPDVIDPTTWLAELDQRLVNLRRSQVSLPVIFGIVFVSELGVGLIGPQPNLVFLALAALVAVAAAALIVGIRRGIPKIEALELKIREAYNLPDSTPPESAS
jgi:hypothetical protein